MYDTQLLFIHFFRVQVIDVQKLEKNEDFLGSVTQQNLVQSSALQLDAPQFEPMGIDPLQFDYNSQLVPPSMDSPNYNMEYNQQVINLRFNSFILTILIYTFDLLLNIVLFLMQSFSTV